MRMNALVTIVAAFALSSVAACAGGSASKGGARVVVMPISGSSAANGAVTEVVESRYDLVSSRRYAKTARKLDAKSKDDEDIRKVSRELDIDALVHGEFVKRGKRKYELRLSLRAGASGEEFESVTVKLRSKKLSDRDRSEIRKKLHKALSEVDTWGKDADTGETASRSRRTRGSDDDERERARKLRKKKQDKEVREEEKRLARSERKSFDRDRKRSSDDEDRDASDRRDREDDRDREDRDDRERDDNRSSKSSKSDSKKSRSSSSSKSDAKKSKRSTSDSSDKGESDRRSKSKKEKREKKKDESYEVITVRDKEGQALDDESPF